LSILSPERLLRLLIEILFLLLGGLVVWLGITGHIFFDRRGRLWLVLSVVLIFWGLRAVYKPERRWSRGENWTRGLSLTLLGIVMLSISRVPFTWVGSLLAVSGVLLALRGFLGSVLVLRPR
jgi:hypothetical protein